MEKIAKIIALVVIVLVGIFLLFNFVFTETMEYYSAVSDNTVMAYVAFRDKYPDSKYVESVNERKALLEELYFEKKHAKNTIQSYEEFIHAFPADKYTSEAIRLRDSLLQVELDIEKYGKNVLPQGTCPYEPYFGKNRESKAKFNSDVVVTAPIAFDMVAVIREKDETGKVVAHAYVRADSTYTFKVDNGKYQLFFYIGKGWNPNKKMEDGVFGGFVRNETYSKDDPVYLSNEVITYQLSMKQKKKSYKPSSRYEVFR